MEVTRFRPAHDAPSSRDVTARLNMLSDYVATAPRPGLIVLPAAFLVVPDFSARQEAVRQVAERLRSRQPSVLLGIDVLDENDGWMPPPPGPLGPWDADVDPYISSFAFLHHRRRGWVLHGERQRVYRPGQTISDWCHPRSRVIGLDGVRLGILFDAERGVLNVEADLVAVLER